VTEVSPDPRAQSFGAVADDYDRFRAEPPDEGVDWIVPEGCAVALDVGAGTGALTRRLAERVERVLAVEPDERMAAVLRTRLPEVEVLTGQAESIPLPDDAVDAVFGASMWHWVDQARAFPEVVRVLRPGGVVGLLWSGPDRSVAWVSQLMNGGVAMSAEEAAQLTQVRARRRQVLVPPGCGLGEPRTRAIRWTRPSTPEELVGLTGTFSSVAPFVGQERDAVLARVAEFVASHPETAGRSVIDLPMGCYCWSATLSVG
jgi:SAM-dependent methyltransferase